MRSSSASKVRSPAARRRGLERADPLAVPVNERRSDANMFGSPSSQDGQLESSRATATSRSVGQTPLIRVAGPPLDSGGDTGTPTRWSAIADGTRRHSIRPPLPAPSRSSPSRTESLPGVTTRVRFLSHSAPPDGLARRRSAGTRQSEMPGLRPRRNARRDDDAPIGPHRSSPRLGGWIAPSRSRSSTVGRWRSGCRCIVVFAQLRAQTDRTGCSTRAAPAHWERTKGSSWKLPVAPPNRPKIFRNRPGSHDRLPGSGP